MLQQTPAAAFVLLALLPLARAQDAGAGFIMNCKPGYFGMSFDDGPSNNTGQLLDSLAAAQVKVSFFIQGNQLSPQTSEFTRRAHEEGHQICSHTWDHKSLNSLTANEIKQEMLMNEEAIMNVTGVIPNYMRPPFGDCNEQCATTLASLGYHVVQWNIDSNDWRYEDTPESWPLVTGDVLKVEDVNTTVTNNPQMGYISLQHDTLSFSVAQVPQIIEKIKALGLQIAPIEQCIDNPPAPMYRGGQLSNQTTPTSSQAVASAATSTSSQAVASGTTSVSGPESSSNTQPITTPLSGVAAVSSSSTAETSSAAAARRLALSASHFAAAVVAMLVTMVA